MFTLSNMQLQRSTEPTLDRVAERISKRLAQDCSRTELEGLISQFSAFAAACTLATRAQGRLEYVR